ncbi:Crp/Fnr family transcriptional regulator [Pelagicoccus sp. SDUM812003]|uniref:Crp/Fnr family transcriptional regulator n=1 Tax=Pelagicoccus sp. SDUM812003 TaxID=3041267 RepID=UPI0028106101|nr:Crp/Fnr family transcriptional regulator [Pelagicoccus sp. SDUM812003]MDQ8201922.1 Crp/Fnr family transcriptional regulator [Pelagicoccus sp. SDUM812003]
MRFSEFLQRHGTPVTISKGSHFFRQGDDLSRLAFVKRGVLRAYYLTQSGSERIKSFIAEGEIIGSLRANTHAMPNPFSVVAAEDCELVQFSFDCFESIASSDLELANEALHTLIDLAIKKERREFEFLCLSPEQRYRSLFETKPAWLDRVTQADIALYIGITPEALSRIRRRSTRAPSSQTMSPLF